MDVSPGVTDLLVLGSGVAGLTAALKAALEGASVTVVEHLPVLGGTSARSSGTVWIPDNQYMRAAGQNADRAAAETYLAALVADRAPEEMWRRFLEQAPRIQAELSKRADVNFRPFVAAPDYRQEISGAASGWRALEPVEFDGRRLGAWFSDLSTPLPEMMLFGGMMVTRAEAEMLVRADTSVASARLGMRLVSRYLSDRLRYSRGTRLVMGNAVVARLLYACLQRNVAIRTRQSVKHLLSDGGRISGAVLEHNETIRASKGVVLAGGGFPSSAEWREREFPRPIAEYSPATPGAIGRTIELGLDAGGVLGPSGRDNALWFPSSTAQRRDGSTAVWPHIVLDRAKPGAIIVGRNGRRFANEAISYHEFVRAMYRANRDEGSVPAFLIFGQGFIRKYGAGLIWPRTRRLRRYIEKGYLSQGADASALAESIGVLQEGLCETISRFDHFAAEGKDPDFQRGETIYDQAGGDPAHGPNPCIGEIGKGPLYAVRLIPTPLGTSRGLSADINARVLDADGRPITGLYVAGNDMQSAFGGEYPGAGAQLGLAMTFGWIAGNHAVGAE